MNFLKQTAEAIAWTGRVLAYLFQLIPGLAATVIYTALVSRITRMLAFLLPLKVILLAGSNGVPGYFHPFVGPDQKDLAVAILATLSIACYFANLICDTLTRKVSERGGDKLMAVSASMSVISNQRAEVSGYFGRFTNVAALALFAVISIALLLWVHPLLASVLLAFIAVSLLFTALVVRRSADHTRGKLATYVADNTGSYVGILSSMAFLIGFLAILYPLLSKQHANMLYSIIAVFVMRQMLSAVSKVAKELVSLGRSRSVIDALFFPQHRLRRSTMSEQGGLHELFEKRRRQEVFAEQVAGLGAEDRVDMRWQDAVLRGRHVFPVTVSASDGGARHFEQHVYLAKITKSLENEELLFQHVSRQEVFAPPLVTRYTYGGFECAVYDAGAGQQPPAASWKAIQKMMQFRLAGLQPPPELVAIFKSSHLLLHEKLTDKAMERLEIAVEDGADRESLARFRRGLPAIQARLAQMPLAIFNIDFRPNNLTATEGDGFQVMSWGQWTLEPLGASFAGDLAALEEFLAHARAKRSDVPSWLGPRHLAFAADCEKLDSAVTRGNFRAALGMLDAIVADLQNIEPESKRLSA